MDRRKFLLNTGRASILPLFLNGLNFRLVGANPLPQLMSSIAHPERVLVVIQLSGGNDGLNTVLPLDQYSNLSKARSNILIPDNKILKLSGLSQTGFHPAMTGLQALYNDGKVNIIQSVGYPSPNFSHFRSSDIWTSASDADKVLYDGWLGRFLNDVYENYPGAYPNADMPDPLAIQIGSMVSPTLQGPSVSMGMAITNPSDFYNLLSGTSDPVPATPAGHELQFIRQVANQTQQYATSIKTAAAKATNKSTKYPSPAVNGLADQLKIVAQLIAGGLKTNIYMVNMSGFDTHASQGAEQGLHATLLNKLSVAIDAFQDDLRLLGVDDRVLGMTFSEFGRRIMSNGSEGTDHGAAAPLFMFGKGVIGGMTGSNPIIPATVNANDNLPMQHDFRTVYSTVLKWWFGANDDVMGNVFENYYPSLNVISGMPQNPLVSTERLLQNYPNPFSEHTKIRFSGSGQTIQLKLYDHQGRMLKILKEGRYPTGVHDIDFDGSQLAGGTYYYQLQDGAEQWIKPMLIVR